MASPPPLVILLLAALSIPALHSYPDAACNHLIYCKGGNGTLLHTVQVGTIAYVMCTICLVNLRKLHESSNPCLSLQMAGIYNDSKTFVDKPLINPVDQVLFNFDVFMQVIISVFTCGEVTLINI